MITQPQIKGLWLPIISPFFHGEVDSESLIGHVKHVESFVDGYVPCLSSGEGTDLSEGQWLEIVKNIVEHTDKPVYAGVKQKTYEDAMRFVRHAEDVGCDGVVMITPETEDDAILAFFERVTTETDLPIIYYNTEQSTITSMETVQKLAAIPQLVGIKDSSNNTDLFAEMCAARAADTLDLAVLQGMEHRLLVPEGCDGYLIALANLEPELSAQMQQERSSELNKQIIDLFWEYNLGADWYVTLKAVLKERGIIRSAEQVKQAIIPE